MRPTESLDDLVTVASSILMPADADTAHTAFGRVLRTLVEHFRCNAGFLRRNDHEIRASIMVTEWPIRPDARGMIETCGSREGAPSRMMICTRTGF